MARSLQFDIVANDKATGKIGAVEKALGGFTSKLGGMVTGFFAVERIATAVMDRVARSFEWGSSLKDAAMAVGLTVEEFQRLEFASKQSGLELGRLQKAFLEIRKLVRDASSGNQQAVAMINALGYSQEQAASGAINYTEAFLKVSEAVTAARTEQDKFNILSGIFGDRVAQDLIPVLSQYAELKRTMADTPIISTKDADTLDLVGDNLDRIGRIIDVLTAKFIVFNQTPVRARSLLSIFGGMGIGPAFTTGTLMNAMEPPEAASEGPTQQAQAMADALSKAGKKVAEQTGAAALGTNLPTMAAIGGAAGFRGGPGGVPRSETLLEQIEQNTRPAPPVPVNGSTNFTAPQGGQGIDYAATIASIRSFRRSDRAPSVGR